MAPSAAEATQGPMLIGIFLNLMLYGIRVTQAFMYYTTYKRDRMVIRLCVTVLLIADTAKVIFDIWYIYDALVINFGNSTALEYDNWIFDTDPALTGVIASMVQLFFAWRVKLVTQNNWAVAVIAGIAIIEGLAGIGTAIACTIVTEYANFQKFEVIVILWLGCAALCDVIITCVLVWHLVRGPFLTLGEVLMYPYQRTHKTGFSRTDDLVDKIIRMTVQTGMLTAVWATADLILFLGVKTGAHLAFNYPLCNLYSNCLMSTLNSRGKWSFSADPDSMDQQVSRHRATSARNEVFQLKTRPEVFINVESHETVDMGHKATDAFTD
ncbi:hypothetical protein BJ138DRAFT_1076449, partial [Hygrophoropsis aurantiaca]